jgi:hypothetical protein
MKKLRFEETTMWIEQYPSRHQVHVHLEAQNMTLLRNRESLHKYLVKMRSYWTRVGPKFISECSYRKAM